MSNVIESKFKVIKNLIDFKVQNIDILTVCVCVYSHRYWEEEETNNKK